MMKFPTETWIAEVRGDQIKAKKYYVLSMIERPAGVVRVDLVEKGLKKLRPKPVEHMGRLFQRRSPVGW